jgi:hypothetical protein
MADMQLLVDFLVQRHPDLAAVKSSYVERHRYTCYVNAFCMGAMRGYTATAVTSADVNDSNFVTMLRSCSKSRLAGLLPFDPQAALSLSHQFQAMVQEATAHAHDSQQVVPEPTPPGGRRLRRVPHALPPVVESSSPEAGPAVSIEHLHAAVMAGRLPGLFGSPADEAIAGDASFEAIGVPFEVLRRVALGAPRRVASGRQGYICYEDLVWLALAVQDAMAGPSIEYWCRVLDSDEDGWIGETDIRQAVRSRVRQQLQLEAMALGHAPEAAASRSLDKVSTRQDALLVEATEQRALIQLVDVMRPASYVAAASPAEQSVRITASQIRHRMAGPVIFHSLVSLRDRVGTPQAAGTAGSEPATLPG